MWVMWQPAWVRKVRLDVHGQTQELLNCRPDVIDVSRLLKPTHNSGLLVPAYSSAKKSTERQGSKRGKTGRTHLAMNNALNSGNENKNIKTIYAECKTKMMNGDI